MNAVLVTCGSAISNFPVSSMELSRESPEEQANEDASAGEYLGLQSS